MMMPPIPANPNTCIIDAFIRPFSKSGIIGWAVLQQAACRAFWLWPTMGTLLMLEMLNLPAREIDRT
jgi:hypothetical protein